MAANPTHLSTGLLLHGTMQVAGSSEFVARFPSAVASILAVALVFSLARRMFGWSAGLAAAAFMAINPFQIWYAQTSRMYAISIALALLTTLVLWTALRRDRWWPWVLYSLLTAAHLYLHYYAIFVALAQGIWVLVAVHRQWRRLMASSQRLQARHCSTFHGWCGHCPLSKAYQGNAESPALISTLAHSLRAFSLGQTIQPQTTTPFLVAFGLLFASGLWYAARSRRRRSGLLALWLFVPIAGTWIASLQRPIFSVKHVITASPPFYLFLGVGAVWMARKKPWGYPPGRTACGDLPGRECDIAQERLCCGRLLQDSRLAAGGGLPGHSRDRR